MTRRALVIVFAARALLGCRATENVAPSGADAGNAGDSNVIDAALDADVSAPFDGGRDANVDASLDRLKAHDANVLASIKLVAIYVGDQSDAGTTLDSTFIPWLLTSNYWKTMQQYGVGSGALVGRAYVARDAIAPSGESVVAQTDLDKTIAALLHPASDGGDADAAVAIPKGDGYVVFLPDGLNVTFTGPDGTPWQTCIEAGGYHAYDGYEPYAVMPPCAVGRGTFALSHELAEMATDPSPGHGWFTDEEGASAGEIADICNASVTVEGWSVTALWSNAAGDCEPSP